MRTPEEELCQECRTPLSDLEHQMKLVDTNARMFVESLQEATTAFDEETRDKIGTAFALVMTVLYSDNKSLTNALFEHAVKTDRLIRHMEQKN